MREMKERSNHAFNAENSGGGETFFSSAGLFLWGKFVYFSAARESVIRLNKIVRLRKPFAGLRTSKQWYICVG
jgi:hypothetical protein